MGKSVSEDRSSMKVFDAIVGSHECNTSGCEENAQVIIQGTPYCLDHFGQEQDVLANEIWGDDDEE
jgi:hypothetical protein